MLSGWDNQCVEVLMSKEAGKADRLPYFDSAFRGNLRRKLGRILFHRVRTERAICFGRPNKFVDETGIRLNEAFHVVHSLLRNDYLVPSQRIFSMLELLSYCLELCQWAQYSCFPFHGIEVYAHSALEWVMRRMNYRFCCVSSSES